MIMNSVNNNLKSNQLEEIAKIMAQAALDKKASDVMILNVSKLTSVADYFVICSAPSERQVQAIARNVKDVLKKIGHAPQSIEGFKSASWILLDYSEIIFHCFTDSARRYYDLEGFFVDAEAITVT